MGRGGWRIEEEMLQQDILLGKLRKRAKEKSEMKIKKV
jgi:hypothetical protein